MPHFFSLLKLKTNERTHLNFGFSKVGQILQRFYRAVRWQIIILIMKKCECTFFFETDYRKKIYSIEWLGWKWDADETISVQDNHLRWEKMAQFKTSGVLN